MSLYNSAKQKLRNVYRTIDSMLEGDFPIESGKNALKRMKRSFEEKEQQLDRAHNIGAVDTERQIANIISVRIIQFLPILGFVLRSTNVRNAFELIDPLQNIAQAVLQGKPHCLISSEWDYVPFAYPQNVEDLRSFVLIGLPASEAGSALLVPLAGHELGHAIWRNLGLEGAASQTLELHCDALYEEHIDEFKSKFPEYDAEDLVGKEVITDCKAESLKYAVLHAEEIFSDMFAYAVFGKSFLYAFAYILAPGSGGPATASHPSHKKRISVLSDIASNEGGVVPNFGALEFAPEKSAGQPQMRFLIKIAESAVDKVVPGLWKQVDDLVSKSHLIRPAPDRSNMILDCFKMNVPAHSPKCIGDIINAGWDYYMELETEALPFNEFSDSVDTLNEMMLKTVEVLEFNRKVK